MDRAKILQLRLSNSGLSGSPFANAAQAVSHLGAVQAQDYGAAKWSLGLRVINSTDETIEGAFNDGEILRTHVMRPTWHFVLPRDIRWMLELTAPRIRTFLAHYNRKLNLDSALFRKSNIAIVKALRNHTYLTRQELKKVLEGVGIQCDVQRLAHIMAWAETDALICSGPRRGKQFTYALLEERAPVAERVAREESLSRLAIAYFRSHGPAQLGDFCWWSGLSMKDARTALDFVKPHLISETIDGKTYWFPAEAKVRSTKPPIALLLSIYDEYTIAYKDRSDLGDERYVERMLSMGNALNSVILLNNKVTGTWKKNAKKNKIEIALSPFRKLKKFEQKALELEVDRYGMFLGIPAEVAK